jgi:mannan endo-1,4-beta-mannosidase
MIGRAQSFVQIKGDQFYIGGKPYHYAGINLWSAMHLGAAMSGDRERLLTELDQLANMGVTNIRIMATSEGPDAEPWRIKPALQEQPEFYNEDLLGGLDFALQALAQKNMRAVICLTNFWPWSGGMAQYVAWSEGQTAIPYPPPAADGSWLTYQLYTSKFYQDEQALTWYQSHIKKIVLRKNSLTGKLYRDDPTIMAWELANEPRAILKGRKYRNWISTSANLIKSLDGNHLVTVGSEGNTPSRWSGNRFYQDHKSPNIDYSTIHVWVENWGWYDPKNSGATYHSALAKAKKYIYDHVEEAKRMGKPIVLEEFGMARDAGFFDPQATTHHRDRFFKDVCMLVVEEIRNGSPLAGLNFWAWAGLGVPSEGGSFWHEDDQITGDPPHEKQGWYSIYSHDYSTHQVISDFAERLRHL